MPTAPRVYFCLFPWIPTSHVACFRGCAFPSRHSMRLWPHLPFDLFQRWRISEGVFSSKTRHPTANSFITAARQSANLFVLRLQPRTSLHILFNHDTAPVGSNNHESICMSRHLCIIIIVLLASSSIRVLCYTIQLSLTSISVFSFFFFCRPHSSSASTWSPRGCVDASSHRTAHAPQQRIIFELARTDACTDGLLKSRNASSAVRPAALL